MKLLIVDDEKLTREGIRDTISGFSLPFTSILLADDGIHGLETALSEKPDIVLTDVRMPRMTGVEMAEAILKQCPDTAIVFMSAYSDKEYLKAAIKLKAVSYVEKPLSTGELEAALKEAVVSCDNRSHMRGAVQMQEKERLGHLAILLTTQGREEEVKDLIDKLHLSINDTTCFFTMILDSLIPFSDLPDEKMEDARMRFSQLLEKEGRSQAYTFRADHSLIIHIFSEKRLDKESMRRYAAFVKESFEPYCHFFLAVGPIVTGPDSVHLSFEKARALLNNSFFHDFNSILMEYDKPTALKPFTDVLMDFGMALAEKQKDTALMLAERLYDSILESGSVTPSQVRDIYYKYFVKLDESGLINHISIWSSEEENPHSIWDGVLGCATLSELHKLLADKTNLYFNLLDSGTNENPVVFQIKEYIHKNYAIPSLSVLDVSEFVHRSSSYVCTLFKNETGQTLNQYLTDYRIKMSKGFLSDPRYKITDISAKVGYSDGNYYSKTFRKIVGLSPSEYREKMLP